MDGIGGMQLFIRWTRQHTALVKTASAHADVIYWLMP